MREDPFLGERRSFSAMREDPFLGERRSFYRREKILLSPRENPFIRDRRSFFAMRAEPFPLRERFFVISVYYLARLITFYNVSSTATQTLISRQQQNASNPDNCVLEIPNSELRTPNSELTFLYPLTPDLPTTG